MAAPLLAGADQRALKLVELAALKVGADGALGAPRGVPEPESDQAPSPAVLPARTWTWYETPAVRLAIVVDVPAPAKAWSVHALAVPRL